MFYELVPTNILRANLINAVIAGHGDDSEFIQRIRAELNRRGELPEPPKED